MWTFLDKIPYSLLIVAALFMLLAPFRPMPHVIEKMVLLRDGALTKPMDIFDLIFHLIPLLLLLVKLYRNFVKK